VKIKVLNSETSTKNEEFVPENDLLDPYFGVQDAHNSTACETTRNDLSIHISPRGASVIETKALKHDVMPEEPMNVPNKVAPICPYHTPESQKSISSILKVVAKLKASSCTSCSMFSSAKLN